MRELRREDRDRGLKCIAQLMSLIRDEWEFNGCLAILRRLPADKTLSEVARAALWFAEHRTKQRTPAMLAEDGAHWHLDDDQRTYLPPKPTCLTEPMGEAVPPERIREIRMKAETALRRDEGMSE